MGEIGKRASASGILQEGTRGRYPFSLKLGAVDGDGLIANHSDDSIRQRMYVKISL
jgi:hypothetical protein